MLEKKQEVSCFADERIYAQHKHITYVENNCNNPLFSAADFPFRVQQVPTQVDPCCCFCFPPQSMGLAEHWHNQFVWIHAASNSNGAMEVLEFQWGDGFSAKAGRARQVRQMDR